MDTRKVFYVNFHTLIYLYIMVVTKLSLNRIHTKDKRHVAVTQYQHDHLHTKYKIWEPIDTRFIHL